MSLDDYQSCGSLEEIATLAKNLIEKTGKDAVFNFCMKATFSADLLSRPQLKDVTAKAELWQQTVCPEELFFSHGQFLGQDGIKHIADELKDKPDSNRALASLICVKDIIDSGDAPLPSFLVFQCTIDGSILYVTAMYRAMEVATFFRINLEEIRMMAAQVYEQNRRVDTVALCLFVTRAYLKPDMNPLEKAEIDRLAQVKLLTTDRERLPFLLRDKMKRSTYPVETGLQNLLTIATTPELPQEMQIPGNSPALKAHLQTAIDHTTKLKELRRKTSHDPAIARLESELANSLDRLAVMIEDAQKGAPT